VSTASRVELRLEDTFARELPELVMAWKAATAPAPQLLALNEDVATELGLEPAELRAPDGVALLAGNDVPDGVTTVAMVYAGHQFGQYSPRLGDGRALLLGEAIDVDGHRRDLHLKGSGRTPFARGGDGKAVVGPMLREFLIGEAMHAMRIPTTRALAVVSTGERVVRDGMLPGAVLTRVAASHLRVGTFEFSARLAEGDVVRRLADYAIERHYPELAGSEQRYREFYERVVDAQASLVARWMLVGFIHGVMNTDNMTISGETIDYGPCAFMDTYDPATVFSSIDHGGRYAYGNQPSIAQWNLARLGETLLPLFGDESDAAVAIAMEVLTTFPDRFREHWRAGMRAKLGLVTEDDGDQALFDDLLVAMGTARVDHTKWFRSLAGVLRGEPDPEGFVEWLERWRVRLAAEGRDADEVAAGMNAVNPIYVPRNHLVDEALTAATDGDLAPFEQLLDVIRSPFDERPGLERYAEPAPESFGRYFQTFCGT
jgi:uncharacterized protein YdiU (UPF0061 family)